MASVNRNQLIAIIAIVLVTNGATAALIIHNDNSSKSPASVKVSGADVNPTSILKQPSQYADHVISVKGTIVHTTAGYYVVSTDKKTPGALKLDFDTNKIDPSKYVIEAGKPVAAPAEPSDKSQLPAPTPDKPRVTTKGPFTVTGKLAPSSPGKPIVFIVESVK